MFILTKIGPEWYIYKQKSRWYRFFLYQLLFYYINSNHATATQCPECMWQHMGYWWVFCEL